MMFRASPGRLLTRTVQATYDIPAKPPVCK